MAVSNCKTSPGIEYSTSATGMWVVMGAYYNATGTFGSQCMAYFYNGNGYTSYKSFCSPYINWTKKSKAAGQFSEDDYQYPVNQNNDTYGSVLYSGSAEEEPDLILVENGSGQIGYVKNEGHFHPRKKPLHGRNRIQSHMPFQCMTMME